jgi:hypothetical protein
MAEGSRECRVAKLHLWGRGNAESARSGEPGAARRGSELGPGSPKLDLFAIAATRPAREFAVRSPYPPATAPADKTTDENTNPRAHQVHAGRPLAEPIDKLPVA